MPSTGFASRPFGTERPQRVVLLSGVESGQLDRTAHSSVYRLNEFNEEKKIDDHPLSDLT